MFLHVGLLRVSLSPVYHLPWHKHCFVVACHLLKAALASASMLFISPPFLVFTHSWQFVCTHTWCVCVLGGGGGGDVLFTSTFHSNFHKADSVCCILQSWGLGYQISQTVTGIHDLLLVWIAATKNAYNIWKYQINTMAVRRSCAHLCSICTIFTVYILSQC